MRDCSMLIRAGPNRIKYAGGLWPDGRWDELNSADLRNGVVSPIAIFLIKARVGVYACPAISVK